MVISMKYTDSALFGISDKELDKLKLSLITNDFNKWAVNRLTLLIDLNLARPDKLERRIWSMINYRIKARDKFYSPKIVKE